MKNCVVLVVLTIIFIFPNKSWSTHIVGAEIHYKYLTGNAYEIRLMVYRDCINGIPNFDSPAYISVFDSSNNRIKDIAVYYSFRDTIPITINDSCTELKNSVCYEVATYIVIDSLPPIPGGYSLVYDRCCWNWSVVNIVNPMDQGILVITKIPDINVYGENSSPYFNNLTPPFLCLNKPLEFDHSATDPNSDSLVYSLFTPFNSSTVINSQGPPDPPPYFPLTYLPPYSLINVMGGVPLTINPHTGFLTAVPKSIGQFVFGVKVEEYRNGLLIGESTRSYQFNVEPCADVTYAAFPNPIEQCGDTVVTFKNTSIGASDYFWRFGDDGSIDSTSSVSTPTHIYSGLGQYNVTLIARSYKGDECNDTVKGKVLLWPNLEGDFNWVEDSCLNFVQFYDRTPSSRNPVSWNWNFGDGDFSNLKNPYHLFELYDQTITYPVRLIVKDIYNCVDTVTQPYIGINRVFEINQIGASKKVVYAREDSTQLYVVADNAVSYSWQPKLYVSEPENSISFASPEITTIFTVLITDDRGCTVEGSVPILVHEYFCGESEVFVPNAFTPNSDGENDYLRVRGENISYLSLNIYNRWGEEVFESSNSEMIEQAQMGWDGTFKGLLQDPGVYVYYLKVTCVDQREFIKKGNITLIR